MSLTLIGIITFVIAIILSIAAISANAVMTGMLAFGALVGVAIVALLAYSPDTDFKVKENRTASSIIVASCIICTLLGGLGMLQAMTVA